VVCLETLGCPRLALIEGEGMAWMTDYPQATRDLVQDVADEAGIDLVRGLRTRAATDGLIALRAGYPSALLASVDQRNIPSHWHWWVRWSGRRDHSPRRTRRMWCGY